MSECKCDPCSKYRKFQTMLVGLSDEHVEYFNALYDAYTNLEYDLEFTKCIIDGSWPGADTYIAKKRQQLKEKQNEVV